MNLEQYLLDIQIKLIETTLIAYNGNITKAAEYLELNRTTLLAKIARFNINIEPCIGYNSSNCSEEPKPKRKFTGINEIKKKAILDTLVLCHFNRKKTSEALNISYRTIGAFIHDAKLDGVTIPDGKRTRRKNGK